MNGPPAAQSGLPYGLQDQSSPLSATSFSRVRRWFGPVRTRLAALVLIAAIPLLLLSGTIAWQNYQLALDATAQTAARLRESAIARHVSAITSAEQVMQALAQVDELWSGGADICHQRLASVLALQTMRYSNIAASDASGKLRCSALTLRDQTLAQVNATRNAALYQQARKTSGFVLGPIRTSAMTGHNVIPAVYPVLRAGNLVGFLYAGLRIDWFASRAGAPTPDLRALWIADGTGKLFQVASIDALGLPPPDVLKSLETTQELLDARSAGGAQYAYASAQLGNGYSLIVAYPAKTDRVAATNLLIRRIGQLGLLLLLGLAAVAIGAHVALCEPLTQLSDAVATWQTTGHFDPNILRDPPTEIRALATSFAEAIKSLADHAARHRVAVSQQDLLMKEIHHRVKNNLQIVASLLNLQASRIRLPEARAEFASARDRVRALATLHRHLYLQGEVHTINMPVFLTELCGQLFQAMGETEGKRIRLGIEASPLQMSSDQAVPLSLIVTEAVSNALKYAFPDGRTGRVDVRLTSDGKTADLMIEDDGVGMPSGKTETDIGPRDGIGITLIRGFARQLGATLVVHEGGGTRYSLSIPLSGNSLQPELAS